MSNDETVTGEADAVPFLVNPPVDDVHVAVKKGVDTGNPGTAVAGVKVTSAAVGLVVTAETPVGAPGSPDVAEGTTATAVLGSDGPPALVAVTCTEYVVPLVIPERMHSVFVPGVQLGPAGLVVTVYPVMALPPVAGAVQSIHACWLPGVVATMTGLSGTVNGVAATVAVVSSEDCLSKTLTVKV